MRIEHISFFDIELVLACNGGSYGGMYSKIFAREKIPPLISLVCKLVPVKYRKYEHCLSNNDLAMC